MKKIKFEIPSWEEGRNFIEKIANNFKMKYEEKDSDLFIDNKQFSLSCHFDDRGFSFVVLKIYNPVLEAEFDELIVNYL